MEYNIYKESYDANLINSWKNGEMEMDVETLRGLLYGYTYTQEYANDLIEDAFSMNYWRDKHVDEDNFDFQEGKPNDTSDYDIMDEIMNAINNVDLYEVDTPQEHLMMEVLDSTGDGKTAESAICVISVAQEYEYLDRKFPYSCLHVAKQSQCEGIDCLYFEKNVYGIDRIYFDIKRWFDTRSEDRMKMYDR